MTVKVENREYGPFEEHVLIEKQEFAQFETYLETLYNLQMEIISEKEQYQLVQSQQASNYERLSETFTMLRRVKAPEDSDKENGKNISHHGAGNSM